MKFLAIGTRNGVEVYAWAQRPYSKFMAFKVSALNIYSHVALNVLVIAKLLF